MSMRSLGWLVAVFAVATVAVGVASPGAALAQSGEPVEESEQFADVPRDTYFWVPVALLARRGMFDGTGCYEGFCPDAAMDRKTMAVWVVRLLDEWDPWPVSESRFDDVDAAGFHAPFIERMADLGVTSGCGDGSGFCPDRNVTRAEMAVFLSRAFKLPEGLDPGFSDVAEDAWFATDVGRLAASGITAGCGDGTRFCPERDTTRAQMATFLARALRIGPSTSAVPTLKSITAGDDFACGLRSDDTVACWGGSLGAPAGTFNPGDHACTDNLIETCWGGHTYTPEGTFKSVVAGWNYACGLRSDDTVACWGGDYWQGYPPDGTFKALFVGGDFVCGLRSDDTVSCWGNNDYGQTEGPEGTFTTLTVGRDFVCGLRSDDTVSCWGANWVGQTDAPEGTFKTLAVRDLLVCGLRSDDTVSCWGINWEGQADAPEGTFKAVAVGLSLACGLRLDDTVVCWGNNDNVQTDPHSGTFGTVAVGGNFACGLRTKGSVACWGRKDYWQTHEPEGTFKDFTIGSDFVCGLRTEDTVSCWGNNVENVNDVLAGPFSALASNGNYVCGLRTEGATVCWGAGVFIRLHP